MYSSLDLLLDLHVLPKAQFGFHLSVQGLLASTCPSANTPRVPFLPNQVTVPRTQRAMYLPHAGGRAKVLDAGRRGSKWTYFWVYLI